MTAQDIKDLLKLSKDDEAITLIEENVKLQPALENRIISLSADWSDYAQDVLDEIDSPDALKARRNKLRKRIISIAEDLFKVDENGNLISFKGIVEETLACQLINEDRFAFLDRTKFRQEIKQSFMSKKAELVLVKGVPESGMSYLGKFLKHLCGEVDHHKFFDLEIPKILDEPDVDQGVLLAEFILNYMHIDADFEEGRNSQFKFIQFINELKTKIEEEEIVPVFFIHDFHRIEGGNIRLYDFIYFLIDQIGDDFPKCIFFLAGLKHEEIRDWHSELNFTTTVYEIEEVNDDDIEKCLTRIYAKYGDKITDNGTPIPKDTYIKGTLPIIKGEGEHLNIKHVGKQLSFLLNQIKSQ